MELEPDFRSVRMVGGYSSNKSGSQSWGKRWLKLFIKTKLSGRFPVGDPNWYRCRKGLLILQLELSATTKPLSPGSRQGKERGREKGNEKLSESKHDGKWPGAGPEFKSACACSPPLNLTRGEGTSLCKVIYRLVWVINEIIRVPT